MATKRELRTALTLTGEREYTAGLERIQGALGGVATEQKLLNSEYDRGDKSAERLTRQHDLLEKKLKLQRERVKQISDAYEASAEKGEDAAEVTQKLGNDLNMANAAVNRTQRELRELDVAMETASSKTAQFKQRMNEAGITAESFGGAVQRAGNRVSAASAAMAGVVITQAVKGWTDLEDSMANVGTIADTTQVSMSELTNQVLAASDATGVAARDISSAVYQAISANVNTADSVGLVEQAAKAAKAGVADVTTVIDGSTSIINAWGIAAGDTESVFDKLLKTQQRGKTTIGELAQSIGLVTGLAPQLNLTIDETLASVAALTMNGVNTSQALTGLRAVMSSILKPTAEAQKEAARLGIQFDAAALKSKGFTAFLEEIEEKTGGSEESLAKLFGSVQGLSEIMLLGGNAADDYASILGDLQDSAGTLNQMFEQRTSSAAEVLNRALNKSKNAAIALGESFAPVITAAAEKAEDFADAIRGMSSEQAANILSTTLWVAGISKGVSVMGGLIRNARSIVNLLGLMGPAGLAAGAAIGTIGAGIYALSEIKKIDANAVLDFSLDASELEKYKIPTTELDDFTVEAEAKLKIKNDLSDWQGSVVEWLTDGKRETPEELEEYINGLDGIISTAYQRIEDEYNNKKKMLDDLLSKGIISPEEYQQRMDELETETSSLKGNLNDSADAVAKYVKKLVSQNRSLTDEEIDELNRLLEALGLTTDAVMDATNAQQKIREGSYRAVRAGVGDDEDRRIASEYIEVQYKADVSDLDEEEENIRKSYSDLMAEASDDEIAALKAEEQAALDEIQARRDALDEARDEMYGELLEGEAKRLGMSVEELQEAMDLYNSGISMYAAPSWSDSLWQLDEDKQRKVERYQELMDKFGDIDMQSVEDVLGYWGANKDDFDVSMLDTPFKMIQQMLDLIGDVEAIEDVPEDYTEIASDAGEGFFSGLSAWGPKIKSAAEGISNDVLNAARDLEKLDKAAARLTNGKGSGISAQGIMSGVNNRVDGVRAIQSASARAINRAAAEGYADAASLGSGVQTTVVNNINYTAGAGTMREARMLSQKLSGIQRNSLIGEGL